MLVQFGNNWIQKIPLTAKLDSAYGLVQFWLSSEFFSSNYFQIGQHVVLLHILILQFFTICTHSISTTIRCTTNYSNEFSLSIRRFWGKGERWKRKRVREFYNAGTFQLEKSGPM